MHPHHIQNILFTPDMIRGRVNELVDHIAGDCRSDNFVMIGILRGSFIFLADLVRDLYTHGIHPCLLYTSDAADE